MPDRALVFSLRNLNCLSIVTSFLPSRGRIGASIGLVPITHESGTLTDLLSAADSACYIAKEQGRNRVHIYEPNDEAVSERHGQMQWVQRIQNVLEQSRLIFHKAYAVGIGSVSG